MRKHIIIVLITVGAFLAGCTKSNVQQASEEFNQLPEAVQKAVRTTHPDAEIADVEQKTRDGATVYEIQFREKDRFPAMAVAADGTLVRYEAGRTNVGRPGTLEGKARGVASSVQSQFSALPLNVQKAIEANAPRAQVVDIRRKEDNGRVFYEIEYAGKDWKPELHVGADGHILKLPAETKPENR